MGETREVEPRWKQQIDVESYRPPQELLRFQIGKDVGWVTPHGTASIETGRVIGQDREDGDDLREFTVKVSDGWDIKIYRNTVDKTGEKHYELVGMTSGPDDLRGGKDETLRECFVLAEKLRHVLHAVSTSPETSMKKEAMSGLNAVGVKVFKE